jgi:hypothetical protein
VRNNLPMAYTSADRVYAFCWKTSGAM